MKRRSFIKTSAAGLVAPTALVSNDSKPIKNRVRKPIVMNGYVGKKIIVLKIHGDQMKNMIQLALLQ